MNALSPDYVYQGLVDRGLPSHIAEGFVRNFQDESGLNPGINEAKPIVPGSRGGFGLAQWTGPRRKQLEAFAAQRGVPVSDPDAQMDFLLTELQGPERKAWERISSAQNAGEAGAAIVNAFLRPAEQHRAKREAAYLGGKAPMGGSYGGQQNALAGGFQPTQFEPMIPVGPVGMAEGPQRPRQDPQMPTRQDAAMMPLEAFQTPQNALAAPLPQYDTTRYNTRRLTNGA